MPVFQLDLQERTDLAGSSRVVDQNVQRLNALQRFLHDGGRAGWRADVACKGDDTAAIGSDSIRGGFQQADIALRQDHLRAFGGESSRDSGANATSASRDQRAFAFKSSHQSLPPSPDTRECAPRRPLVQFGPLGITTHASRVTHAVRLNPCDECLPLSYSLCWRRRASRARHPQPWRRQRFLRRLPPSCLRPPRPGHLQHLWFRRPRHPGVRRRRRRPRLLSRPARGQPPCRRSLCQPPRPRFPPGPRQQLVWRLRPHQRLRNRPCPPRHLIPRLRQLQS